MHYFAIYDAKALHVVFAGVTKLLIVKNLQETPWTWEHMVLFVVSKDYERASSENHEKGSCRYSMALSRCHKVICKSIK